MGFYADFLLAVSLPALTILVGIQFAIALVKYFKKKKDEAVPVVAKSSNNKTLQYVSVAILHTVATLLSPIPTAIVALMIMTVLPVSPIVLWIIGIIVCTGFIAFLVKFIGWLAKPLVLSSFTSPFVR